MRGATRTIIACTILLAAASCGGRTPPAREPSPRAARSAADRISREEIQRGHWANAYDLIENLRPRWLRAHGPDTILGDQVVVQVHLDASRLGGIETLRGIPVGDIESIEWVDPVSAAARWGADHANGTIVISTRSH